MRVILALALIVAASQPGVSLSSESTTKTSGLSVRRFAEVYLPSDGSVFFGPEPAAVTTPGVVSFVAPMVDREIVNAGGVKVSIVAGEVIAFLETTAGPVMLTLPAADPMEVEFRWLENAARLAVTGSVTAIGLFSGTPTPNLDSLTVGAGGGDLIRIQRFFIGKSNIFADGFEAGHAGAWTCVGDCGPHPAPFRDVLGSPHGTSDRMARRTGAPLGNVVEGRSRNGAR